MRDLSKLQKSALFGGRAARLSEGLHDGLCDLVWQGDFGKGIATGSGVFSEAGANPCLLYGPITQSTSVEAFQAGFGSGAIPQKQWREGMSVSGDYGADFVFCKLVLAATTDLMPGQVYWLDESFSATLLSTTNTSNPANAEIVVCNVFFPACPAGTYYVWGQRAGHCSVQAVSGSAANGYGETNAATAGALKFPATATSGQKSVSPTGAYVASSGVQFTGNTTNGSPYITNVVSAAPGGGIADLQLGQVITGTNLPSNSIIAAIDKSGGLWRVSIGTNTTGAQSTLQNATGTASGTTFTVTSHVTANMYWPTLFKQN